MLTPADDNYAVLTASIDDAAFGRWLVSTESSEYVVDCVARTIVRYPREGQMRRDGEVLALVAVIRCRVGESAWFLVGVRRDGAVTWRTTSHVLSIARIDAPGVPSRAKAVL